MDDDFRDRFLEANANAKHIAFRFAEVLRNLMRAVAANDPSRALYVAAQDMKLVVELIERCESPETVGKRVG